MNVYRLIRWDRTVMRSVDSLAVEGSCPSQKDQTEAIRALLKAGAYVTEDVEARDRDEVARQVKPGDLVQDYATGVVSFVDRGGAVQYLGGMAVKPRTIPSGNGPARF